jgi:phage tail-like protein
MTMTDPFIATFFAVRIDGRDIGTWTSVALGGIELELHEVPSGGRSHLVAPQTTGRLKYQNITLRRQVNADTAKVANWFAEVRERITRSTGEITAIHQDGSVGRAWAFIGAVPIRWTLPTFDVARAEPVMETLEIAHQGFVF